MPTLAGWITGEQVPQKIIEQTLAAMGAVLGTHGGEPAQSLSPGAGLLAFSDAAYAMRDNDEPPVLDWVPERRTLVYRRPLSGLHPLYYIENWPAKGNLLFASEIKALLAVGAPRRLHLAALDALRRYGFIPAPWTAFKDIQIIPAGSILRWQRAKIVLNSSTDYSLDVAPSTASSMEELRELLEKITTSLLPTQASMVALTNGASASALLALLAASQISPPSPILTYGYTTSTEAGEWEASELIAEACDAPFLSILGVDQPDFWPATLLGLEAPCVDTRPLALHQLLHTAAVETQARAALSGLGAGYLLGTTLPSAEERTEESILRHYRRSLVNEEEHAIWTADVASVLHNAEAWEETLHARKLARHAEQLKETGQEAYYLDLHLRMPDYAVHSAYALATQERIALRSPYLHAKVLEKLTQWPDAAARSTAPDTLLRQVMPHLKNSASTAHFPLAVSPASLLQNSVSELVKQVLSQETTHTIGLFDPERVQTLRSHDRASRDLLLVFTTQLLWQLFGIEGWV